MFRHWKAILNDPVVALEVVIVPADGNVAAAPGVRRVSRLPGEDRAS